MSGTVREPATNDRVTEAFAASRVSLPGFILDVAAGELLTCDRQVAGLRKQALDVLLVLGANAGHVVTKDDLMRLVWRDVVVGDGSLTHAISDIRHVLRDKDHRLVRNVARRGYMLVPGPGLSVACAGTEPSQAPATRNPDATRNPLPARAPLTPEVPSVSLVILPLKSTADADDDWFADAITTDLTIGMSRMSGSFVIGRDTAFAYKGKQTDPRDVARELGVRYVVVGSTRRDGDRVRLNLSMVDGESGVQQWGQQFVIERAELERSIDDIVGQLARSLFVELFHSVGERAARLKTTEVAADDLAMRGWSVHLRGLSAENVVEAQALFEQALSIEPDSVRALAGVTCNSNFGVITGWLTDRAAALRKAEESSARIEQLGRDDYFTLIARCSQLNVRGERESMLRAADTLVARFPNDPMAYQQRCTALMYLSRFEESILSAERAIQISPRDTRLGLWYWYVANNQFMLRQYEAATESARRMHAASPNFPLATPLLAATLVRSGHNPEAERLLRDYLATHPHVAVSSVTARMRSDHPRFVEGRNRMIASLREIGLR